MSAQTKHWGVFKSANGRVLSKGEGVSHMRNFLSRFIANEQGVTAIEYGLIAAGIAVVIIGAVQLIGTNMNTTFGNIAGDLG
jgi:pilus assembly protein Flp/PilA